MEFSLAWRLLSSGKGQARGGPGEHRALASTARELLRAQGLRATPLGLGEKATGVQPTLPFEKEGGLLGGFPRPGYQWLPHSSAPTSQSLGWNKRLGSLGNCRVYGLSQSPGWAGGGGGGEGVG